VRGDSNGARPTVRAELDELQAALRRGRRDLADAEKKVRELLARLPADEQPR
jgi:hypothetical protein